MSFQDTMRQTMKMLFLNKNSAKDVGHVFIFLGHHAASWSSIVMLIISRNFIFELVSLLEEPLIYKNYIFKLLFDHNY